MDGCTSMQLFSPPLGSSSILSMDLGPSVVRMMSATAWVSRGQQGRSEETGGKQAAGGDITQRELCDSCNAPSGPGFLGGDSQIHPLYLCCHDVCELGLPALLPLRIGIEHGHGQLHNAAQF